MTDHNILCTAGYGQLAQPSVHLSKARQIGRAVARSINAPIARRMAKRSVLRASTDTDGQLGGSIIALE